MLIVLCSLLIITGIRILREQEKAKPTPGKEELYGEFLTWKEVNVLFPKFATATVTDCETGLKFTVQRRAGNQHSDVQPLTAADTATMKKIYGGKWNWKRRAVIVEVKDGRRIAGSMNGMPHGQGAIKGNNFNGHFCIHFRDSKTHGSHRVDLAHQMMIWKAAGVFSQQVNQMNQKDCIRVLFTAVNENDWVLAARMMLPCENTVKALESFQKWQSVKVEKIEMIDDKNDNTFKVDLLVGSEASAQQTRRQLLITAHGSGEGSLYNFQPVPPSDQ